MKELEAIRIFLDEKNVPKTRGDRILSMLERIKILEGSVSIAYKLGHKAGVKHATSKGRTVEKR